MTDAQRVVYVRARSRLSILQPIVSAALIRSLGLVVQAMPESKLAQLIRDGAIDDILTVMLAQAVLDRATLPLRLALRDVVERAFRFNVPYLPNAGKVDGTVAVFFDHLNPRVTEALRSLDSTVITSLHESIRDTVRQTIARGLEERQAPATIARTLRSVIGLAPKDEAAAANFRQMLVDGDRTALSRLLRDRRFDATLEKKLGAEGKGLTEAQIDKMVDAYRKRAIANTAETVARTATKDAYKIAQRESWQSAIDRGIVDGGSLRKQWIGVNDDRERPEHLKMNDEVARFDSPYSSGQMYAGAGDYNCRCVDRYFVARP